MRTQGLTIFSRKFKPIKVFKPRNQDGKWGQKSGGHGQAAPGEGHGSEISGTGGVRWRENAPGYPNVDLLFLFICLMINMRLSS